MWRCCTRQPKARRSFEVEFAPTLENGGLTHNRDRYPMFVVRASVLLEMNRIEAHEVLRKTGAVMELPAGARDRAVFVSHQWCGRYHPDPRRAQLQVLQAALRRAIAGTLKVQVAFGMGQQVSAGMFRSIASWFVWYDYFSVPQPAAPQSEVACHTDLDSDLGRAIASLSYYVERCRWFFVLAPVVLHEEGHHIDYNSWRERGWCRFERLARVLSPATDTDVLLIRDDTTVRQAVAHTWRAEPVGCGSFSVESDRARIAAKLAGLLQKKLKHLAACGCVGEHSRWMASFSSLFEGLPIDWTSVRPVGCTESCQAKEFLTTQHFSSATDRVHGTTALHAASALGNVEVMESLLSSRASVHYREKRDVPRFIVVAGETPLHSASLNGHPAAVSLLLLRRADVNAKTRVGATPLFYAVRSGDVEVQRELIRSRVDLSIRNRFGNDVLDASVAHNKVEAVRFALTTGVPTCCNEHGMNALHMAGWCEPMREITSMLVEAGVSMSDRFEPKFGCRHWVISSKFALSYQLGRRGILERCFYHGLGGTPLHFAVAAGSASTLRTLLELRGDPALRNRQGLSVDELLASIGDAAPQRRSAQSVRNAWEANDNPQQPLCGVIGP
mmetsp:Transcript_2267/g.6486  ORF Transcript_2267/g.6486 Transcript_2267/m.6486 type:complete len:615 (-) Transcript_2267:208-2052(-)